MGKIVGGGNYDTGADINIDAAGNIYITGTYRDTADFDPDTNFTYNLISSGASDVFIAKFKVCLPTYAIISQTECDSLVSPSGKFKWIVSGTYMDTIANKTGCDSIITFNLLIKHSTNSSMVISACDSLIINFQTFYATGVYQQQLVNSVGCDSFLTIHLTIGPLDVSVTQTGAVLTANATNVSYQWVDCDNGYAIFPGQTNQSIGLNGTISYAVIITQNTCVDTSACYSINGIPDYFKSNSIKIWPNPTHGKLIVNFNMMQSNIMYKLRNYSGHELMGKSLSNCNEFDLDITNYASGFYFLEIVSGNSVLRTKIVMR